MQKILVLDFGGQYNQLIARRVRECGVYSELKPYNTPIDEIKREHYSGIILTGGPKSVTDSDAPICDNEIFNLGIPLLGICYGCQLIAYMLGGKVERAEQREYGKTAMTITGESQLYKGVKTTSTVWMSHTFFVSKVPNGFDIIATSDTCPVDAMQDTLRSIYAVQYHPEVRHSEEGQKILSNFIHEICGCDNSWTMSNFAVTKIAELKQQIGEKKVLLGLSGGVDSSVAALLLHKAVGSQLTCIFVDHGLLRKDEAAEVGTLFKGKFGLNVIMVDAKDRFFDKLSGVRDPEAKRKIIGEEFIRVFEAEAKKIGKVDFLAQGTIYPDVVESGHGQAALIKSHHNVGGLPEHVDFEAIVEPLRNLFKDEVRATGLEIGLPAHLVNRQPFPGPGLGVRVIGDLTREKVEILQNADAIFRDEIAKAGLESEINQYFAVLTDTQSVGVMGDERTYAHTVALRAVSTDDFMTADWSKIPYDVLGRASSRIVNEVHGINRIVYDITSKPPATIEWE